MCKVHDLRETRIYIIDTVLKNNNYPTTNTIYVLQYSNTRVR